MMKFIAQAEPITTITSNISVIFKKVSAFINLNSELLVCSGEWMGLSRGESSNSFRFINIKICKTSSS